MNLFTTVAAVAVGSWVAMSGGAWSPSPTQVTEIQGGLKPFVLHQATEQRRKLPDWSSYTFQYQGRLDGGLKVVFINAFCISPPEHTQQQFVLVLDGGTCFFEVKYDPNKKRFFQLTFHGEA
jgi:hypothetical protein